MKALIDPRTRHINDDIFSRREAGETLKAIGERYGVSQERIRQRLARIRWERAHPPNPGAENLREIGFSTRTINCLISHGITTRTQLQCYSARDLMRIPNMGRVSIGEISRVVSLAESPVDKLVRAEHLIRWLRSLLLRAHNELPNTNDFFTRPDPLRHEIRAALLRTEED